MVHLKSRQRAYRRYLEAADVESCLNEKMRGPHRNRSAGGS